MKRAALLAIAVICALISAGCDDVERNAFGGLIGTVGYPPITNCRVEIYDAMRFKDLDSSVGLVAVTKTNGAGKFAVEFGGVLGRPLVVVARPGAGAMYRDFSATGATDAPFDPPRRPWVGVLDEWLGGEDTVSVNAITTVAFHALMRLPAAEVGGGALRFDREVVDTLHAAVAANFGFRSDPGTELPAPPGGPLFAPSAPNFLEDNDRATAYTYACLQLAKAANEFCTTSPGADSALDFFEALFRDAEDGALDGNYFAQPEPFLNQVPSVVGREASGASRLFTFIHAQALTATETGYAGAARGGAFNPAPAFMLGLQQVATGACRPTRIDNIDVWNFPFSGNVELTVRGAGLRGGDWFVLRDFANFNDAFVVDRNSVGVDGTFNFHSDSELRVRLPDFALTTKPVPPGLRMPVGANFRRLRLEVLNRPEFEQLARTVTYVMTDDARVTNRSEPLLVHAAIGRVDAPGPFSAAAAADSVYPAAQDPAALTPGVDRVFELRIRVCNPSPDAVNNLTLSLTSSTFTQLADAVVADLFGGAAPARAVILPGTLPAANLNPGDVATLAYRLVFVDSAIPADLDVGQPVVIKPVLSGISARAGNPAVSTNDVTDFTRTVSIAPVLPASSALLAGLAVNLPVTVPDGGAFNIDLVLTSGPAGQRDLVVDAIDVTVTFDGATTNLRLGDSFFATPGESGLRFTSFVVAGTGAKPLPLTLSAVTNARTLRLSLQLTAGHLGPFNFTAAASGHDSATGAVSTANGNGSCNVVP